MCTRERQGIGAALSPSSQPASLVTAAQQMTLHAMRDGQTLSVYIEWFDPGQESHGREQFGLGR